MRNISANGLAKLRTRLGNEPICIVEIDWVPGSTSAYADRTVASIPGKIVELSELDDVTSASGHSSNQQVTVTLDDVDGTIKALLDAHDVHKRPARVYQYFSGLDLFRSLQALQRLCQHADRLERTGSDGQGDDSV